MIAIAFATLLVTATSLDLLTPAAAVEIRGNWRSSIKPAIREPNELELAWIMLAWEMWPHPGTTIDPSKDIKIIDSGKYPTGEKPSAAETSPDGKEIAIRSDIVCTAPTARVGYLISHELSHVNDIISNGWDFSNYDCHEGRAIRDGLSPLCQYLCTPGLAQRLKNFLCNYYALKRKEGNDNLDKCPIGEPKIPPCECC